MRAQGRGQARRDPGSAGDDWGRGLHRPGVESKAHLVLCDVLVVAVHLVEGLAHELHGLAARNVPLQQLRHLAERQPHVCRVSLVADREDGIAADRDLRRRRRRRYALADLDLSVLAGVRVLLTFKVNVPVLGHSIISVFQALDLGLEGFDLVPDPLLLCDQPLFGAPIDTQSLGGHAEHCGADSRKHLCRKNKSLPNAAESREVLESQTRDKKAC